MKKIFIKIMLIIFALAGIFLLANVPDFSTKANDENYRMVTDGDITVNKTIHDFGTIKENGGKVSTTFIITNNTQEPVVITHVVTSCGCTISDWAKEPIESGKAGKVTVTFNPKDRIGPFDKSITITTTADPKQIVVRIKGTVKQDGEK